MKTQLTPFAKELLKAIRSYIKSAIKDGTTGMSADNLIQCVRTPSISLTGAPLGTNGRYYYAQLFRELCQTRNVAPFILK